MKLCSWDIVQALWRNKWLLSAMVLQTVFLMYLLISPGDGVTHVFAGLVSFPASLRGKLLGIMLANLVAAFGVEFAIRGVFFWLRQTGRYTGRA